MDAAKEQALRQGQADAFNEIREQAKAIRLLTNQNQQLAVHLAYALEQLRKHFIDPQAGIDIEFEPEGGLVATALNLSH